MVAKDVCVEPFIDITKNEQSIFVVESDVASTHDVSKVVYYSAESGEIVFGNVATYLDELMPFYFQFCFKINERKPDLRANIDFKPFLKPFY